MKALDRWARDFGYNDFDTYIRAGGSRREAGNDIRSRTQALQSALNALLRMGEVAPRADAEPENAHAAVAGTAPDVEASDEPAETDNAQIQGAENP